MNHANWEDDSTLCCCEYIDKNGHRNHLLACCCNCEELDLCCERCLSGKRISREQLSKVMLTCLDRIRFPFRGGARKCTISLLPAILIPVISWFALISFETLIFTLLLTPCLLLYSKFYFTKVFSTTSFFYYWTITSVCYIYLLFQFCIVPQLEVYPHENRELIVLLTISFTFFYFTKTSSVLNNNSVDNMNGELLSNGAIHDSICPVCRIKVYPRSFHCHICQVCVSKYNHHCIWLNCCIGEHNQHYFIFGLLFGIIGGVYGSMITLTIVCQPVKLWIISVPEDCSDVLSDTMLGISFIAAIYTMQMSVCMILVLLFHIYYVSTGFTGLEWQLQPYLCATSPYSRGFLQNWLHLLKSFKCRSVYN